MRMRVRRRKHIALHRGPAPRPAGRPSHGAWTSCTTRRRMVDPPRAHGGRSVESPQSTVRGGVQHLGHGVAVALDRAMASEPAPRSITVDHGTEFMSRALEDWAFARDV